MSCEKNYYYETLIAKLSVPLMCLQPSEVCGCTVTSNHSAVVGWLMLSCLRRGTGRDQGPRRWIKRRLCLMLYCHDQSDSCIKMDSSESHCNVLLIVMDNVTWQFSQTTTFEERERGAEAELNQSPSAYQPNALLQGQTGSLTL